MRKRVIALAGAALFVMALGVLARAQDKPANVAGAWDLSMPGRDGAMNTQAMTIEQNGGAIKGTIKGQRGEVPLEGSVKGNDITFTVKRTTPNGEVTQEYKGTLDGGAMKGTATTGDRSVNWTAAHGK
jgi:hypothetical protein